MLLNSILKAALVSFVLRSAGAWSTQPQNIRLQTALAAKNEFIFEVSFEGRTCKVPIQSDETILSAMERALISASLTQPVPSDCRRGNCMTCSGKHLPGSRKESLLRGEDGLSPHMSRELKRKGHVLLCSSSVVGEGLKLQLGTAETCWREMFRDRLENEEAQLKGRAAMAKTIRLSSERNVEKWTEETEKILDRSGE
jgi:ferredoxin